MPRRRGRRPRASGDLRGGRSHRRRPPLLHGVPDASRRSRSGPCPRRRRARRSSPSPRRTSGCVRSWSSCPTSTGPTIWCSSCSTACSERSAALPFVVVATARVDQDFRWRPQGRHNTVAINLDPLDRVAARQLLDSVAEARLPRRVADQLLDRSGGNPFFLEELASLICDVRRRRRRSPRAPRQHPRARRRSPRHALSGRAGHARRRGRAGPLWSGDRAGHAGRRPGADRRACEVRRRRARRARRPRVEGPPVPGRRPLDVPVRVGARGRLQHAHQGVAGPPPRRDRRAVRQRRSARPRRAPRAGRGAPRSGE